MRIYRWIFGIIAGLVLAVCTFYPQLKLQYNRGESWQGNYAFNDIDEFAYAGYLHAVMDGRPRKNDPFSGRDDSIESPQPESLFSIQFATPYLVGKPLAFLGFSTPSAMTIAGVLAGFLAAMFLFWFFLKLSDDAVFSMAAAIVVLCCGALFAGEGAIGEILGDGFSYPYFPAFRRYVPAVPFAVFMAIIGAVWQYLQAEKSAKRFIYGALATVGFAFTVFSYFYVWTSAAAFLALVLLGILIARPDGFLSLTKRIVILGGCWIAALIPYAWLLSKRSHTMDNVQLLVRTHAPDLYRFPEYISAAALVLLVLAAIFRSISVRSREFGYLLAIILTPFLLFNQQIITGQSLQPIHYQVFVGNYIAGIGLLAALFYFLKPLAKFRGVWTTLFVLLAIGGTIWGITECHYTVRVLDEANIDRDIQMPVLRRLKEISLESARPIDQIVFATDGTLAEELPTHSPQSVLWSRHQHVFAGLTWQESKERYYQYLFFHDLDADWLDEQLRSGDFVSMIALFGWGRHSNRLSSEAKPLTSQEITNEVEAFREYCRSYSTETAKKTPLALFVTPLDYGLTKKNLERFYAIDSGEVVGTQIIHRLKLK